MKCFHPVEGIRGPGGKLNNTSGFSSSSLVPMQVRCGWCIGCRVTRARDWSIRIMHEAKFHEENCFLTLTYDDKNIPGECDDCTKSHGAGSLCMYDWQCFAKRFRKRFGKFRYYAVGEYGEQTSRPHYHVCLFGHSFGSDRKLWKRTSQGHSLYVSRALEQVWKKGYCPFGELTWESAAYVSGYIIDKLHGAEAERAYGRRLPEFATMSRRPGIGANWYEKWRGQVQPRDQVIHNSTPRKPPRFYDRMEEEYDEAFMRGVKRARVIGFKSEYKLDLYDPKLEAMEKNAWAKRNLKVREA